jgi:hypothetical protein
MRRRIINHWTGGNLEPCDVDFEHYHYLIDSFGKIYNGKYKIEDNDNCQDEIYAAHTGGGNTKSIGVAVCGMAGFISPENPGKCLLTRVQMEKLFYLNAILLYSEGFKKVCLENLLTHYEFGIRRPDTSSKGKIDLTWLSPWPELKKEETGKFIRGKTNFYLNKIITKQGLLVITAL